MFIISSTVIKKMAMAFYPRFQSPDHIFTDLSDLFQTTMFRCFFQCMKSTHDPIRLQHQCPTVIGRTPATRIIDKSVSRKQGNQTLHFSPIDTTMSADFPPCLFSDCVNPFTIEMRRSHFDTHYFVNAQTVLLLKQCWCLDVALCCCTLFCCFEDKPVTTLSLAHIVMQRHMTSEWEDFWICSVFITYFKLIN